MPDLPPPPSGLLEGAALFLDFDGTLVELAETPSAIRVPAGLGPRLAALRERLNGRLVIVSGRSLDDLERWLPLQQIACAGSHGLELRLADGTRHPVPRPDGLDQARERIERFAAGVEGLIVEPKPAGVALHYRRAPAQAARVARLMEELAETHGLALQRGKMVEELRSNGANKGDALRAFMAEPNFQGASPVFVGDDLTDEHGFAAAAALGGAGVLVGPPRATAASFRLESVDAAAAWLDGAVA
jgi:trehalose 6-phosphate phosphatase